MIDFFRQCELSKGKRRQTAYIPESFAKKNAIIRLLDDDGWRVDRVGVHRVPGDYLKDYERQYFGSIA